MTGALTRSIPAMWWGEGCSTDAVRTIVRDRDVAIIADSRVSSAKTLAGFGRMIEIDASRVDVDRVTSLAQELTRSRPQIIIAVGGGTVIDACKIAALGARSGHALTYLVEHSARSGLTVLPPGQSSIDLVAIPTTVGTSAETNSVGILRTKAAFRLIVGHSLRPRYAILDSDHLMGLPDGAIRAGALEALLRLAGASTNSRRTERACCDAATIARALIEAASGDLRSPRSRLRVARLSAATQRSGALRGRDPYAARHWYVANEVAFNLGVTKMSATAAIVGAVWRRVCAGDSRWGEREALEDFWRAATNGTPIPRDPVVGIEHLIESSGIRLPAAPGVAQLESIAAATESTWGTRHPMLRGISDQDVRVVLRDSSWGADEPGMPLGQGPQLAGGVIHEHH